MLSKDLAEETGLSPVTITRLEKAGNPSDETISLLAKALEFPEEFFVGDDVDIPTSDSASFRSLKSMTAGERDAALTAGAVAFLFSDWVDGKFNLPALDILDFAHGTEPEAAARSIRQLWGLGEQPISNVIKLLESKGIRVFSLAENTRNVDAYSCWRGNVPYIFLNTMKTAEHSRFDAAHELGHLVLHRHGVTQGNEVEKEANLFASHFLIPPTDLVSHLPRVVSVDQLVNAKRRWGVSTSALAYRMHKSSFMSDWQYKNTCIQINKRFGKTEPNGLEREQSVVWEKIFRELWKDGITRDDLAQELSIPTFEIDNLVFGLAGGEFSEEHANTTSEQKPRLKLV